MATESSLTIDERATNYETFKHIERVRNLLNICVAEILKRGEKHDQSKLAPPEVSLFAEYTPILSGLTYGSKEYEECKQKIKPALDHHYANNRHHTEHFRNGINDMNLIDLVEMFCDWKAATERHNDGNLRKSIDINKNKYNISDQLAQIFHNTVELLDE